VQNELLHNSCRTEVTQVTHYTGYPLHRLPVTQVTRYTGYTGYTGQSHQSKVKCDCQAMPLAPIHHSCRTTWLLQFEQAAVEVLEKHLTENEDEASAEPKQQGVQVRHRHCVDM